MVGLSPWFGVVRDREVGRKGLVRPNVANAHHLQKCPIFIGSNALLPILRILPEKGKKSTKWVKLLGVFRVRHDAFCKHSVKLYTIGLRGPSQNLYPFADFLSIWKKG